MAIIRGMISLLAVPILLIFFASAIGCQGPTAVPLGAATANRQQTAEKVKVMTVPYIMPGQEAIICDGQVEPPEQMLFTDYPLTFGTLKWPKMQVIRDIPVYEAVSVNSQIIAKLIPGDVVQAVTGQLHVKPEKIMAVADFISTNGRKVKAGDVLFALHRYEEGIYLVWQNGRVFTLELYGVNGSMYHKSSGAKVWGEMGKEEPDCRVWLKVPCPDGRLGWVEFYRADYARERVK